MMMMMMMMIVSDLLEARGTGDLRQFLGELGGWPVIGGWDSRGFDLVTLLVKARSLLGNLEWPAPAGVIVGLSIQRDLGRPQRYAIYIDEPSLGQGGFGYTRNLYIRDRHSLFIQAYQQFISDIAMELNGHADHDVISADVDALVAFETALAEIMDPVTERRVLPPRYNRISIRDLQMKYPKFDWLRFIQGVASTEGAGVKVSESDDVILWAERYYDKLCDVLLRTPPRTLANYIVFRSMLPLLGAMNQRFRLIGLQYSKVINGAEAGSRLPPRRSFCTNLVDANMGWLTSQIFVQRHFGPEKLARSSEILRYVRQAYMAQIAGSRWLSQHTKRQLLAKLQAIKDNVGFPDYVFNDRFIADYYKYFTVDGVSLFKTLKGVLQQNFVQAVRQLVHPQLDRWLLLPSSVNAFHNIGQNSIEIPAGIIAEPFFSLDFPWSMNFGGIGFLMAHEYTHAYDTRGVNADGQGLLRQPYWSLQSLLEYSGRGHCIIRHFSEYFVPEANEYLDGDFTLNENLCDLAGIKAGYYAYKQWAADHRSEPEVANLPFTHDQLYFINAAKTHCARFSPQYTARLLLTDTHAIEKYRVYGPFRNLPEFAEAFRCPLNSYMNPPNKCPVW